MPRQRRHQQKHVTAAQHRTTLRHILISRETLDGLDVGSLVRSFGLALAEVEALVAEEQMRRRARA